MQIFKIRELNCHPLINKHKSYTTNRRWQRYWKWVTECAKSINLELHELEIEYRDLNLKYIEAKQVADLEVMQSHEVIGLTTTHAAKIQASLRSLRAPIVLVEEAAEILEAHIICSMTKHCQQVILIGDHKQLRPKASVYELGTKFNLNVSLFERMVNMKGGECPQLTYQHRMRPEIAKLITPSIYDLLLNDKSVYVYPPVKGLDKNVFFLHHTNHEENHSIDDSWVNQHEVEFLVAFAKHLLMQGYSPSEITILCTYTGQLFAFNKETVNHMLLRQVKVTTVDNYQGEENKIILLSLVRNNGEGNVGFLREENRVCVALSRAREGLYIMGNIDDLLVKNSIWPKIKQVLDNQNAIGDTLKLQCAIHQEEVFEIKNADDFKQCPEGGCNKKCDLLLACSHTCTNVCHIIDREHKNYRCKQKCIKSCPNDHPCTLLCWQECQRCLVKVERTLTCGHTVEMPCSFQTDLFPCPVKVEVTLPSCNHNVEKPCFVALEKADCTHDCEIRLDCGHACLMKCHVNADPDHIEYQCHKDCTRKNINCEAEHFCKKRCFEKCEPCPVRVDKTRSCGHHYKQIPCFFKVEDAYCERYCGREMPCGHTCKLKCSDICDDCSEKVKKESVCGHTVEVKCSEEATPLHCNKKCKKILPCGHQCIAKCKDQCTSFCKVMVQLSEPGICGHNISVPCYLNKTDPKSFGLLKYCKETCGFELACGHICAGNCGSCLQGRMHILCNEPCRNVFICGHACKTLCNQECQPCNQKCEIKCKHNKCGRKCGIPCVPCKEKCERRCAHRVCRKRCYEKCDIDPCDEPCSKKLKCSHSCIGFCGEPCPPLCRICNEDQVTEIFLGNEDNPNARFVLLPDCKHLIESKGLMEWIKPSVKTDEVMEIKIPTCPKCKTPIKSCTRLMDQIKEDLKNVISVKEKLFSNNRKDLEEKQKQLLRILMDLEEKFNIDGFMNFKYYLQYLKTFGTSVKNKRKQYLSIGELNAYENIVEIVSEITFVLKKMNGRLIPYEYIENQVELIVKYLPSKLLISKQRLDDIQLELRRLHLMVSVYNLFTGDFAVTMEFKGDYEVLVNKLLDVKRFTENLETEIIISSKAIDKKKSLVIERKTVVKAIGLSLGHWFKCPNGHFYAIGECGGAMERSKCIECKATVGGAHHQLDSTNSLAPEVDGAAQPAWPTVLDH